MEDLVSVGWCASCRASSLCFACAGGVQSKIPRESPAHIEWYLFIKLYIHPAKLVLSPVLPPALMLVLLRPRLTWTSALLVPLLYVSSLGKLCSSKFKRLLRKWPSNSQTWKARWENKKLSWMLLRIVWFSEAMLNGALATLLHGKQQPQWLKLAIRVLTQEGPFGASCSHGPSRRQPSTAEPTRGTSKAASDEANPGYICGLFPGEGDGERAPCKWNPVR